MMTPRLGSCCAAALTALLAGAAGAQTAPQRASVKVDSATISGLGARNIGSAAMSGRIAALAAVHEGPRLTVYVGAASGGVWKSVNGGTTFKPVFDKQAVQSIGAITIDPKNPKVIWVGSGEAWTRNSASIGDGVYKSTDGGDNWTNLGLKESERIAKILVDPTESNTVYVCVSGKLWSDSDERGVFKTTDGGKTWTKVLKGPNASTGCSMMSMDPQNPKTLFAGMWDFRRKGWTFRSGGDGPDAPSGSGLFKSTDGGASGSELQQHRGRLARRLPRRVGRSHQHRPPHRGRRRRPVVLVRRRQQVVEGRQSPGVAVLPRQRGHGPPLPRLRRPAGQQLLGRRVGVSGRHHEQPVGEHVRWRRLLDVRRSHRPRLRLRRVPGRRDRPRQPQDSRIAQHQAPPPLRRGQAALQLEHAHSRESDAQGHDLHRRSVPVPFT